MIFRTFSIVVSPQQPASAFKVPAPQPPSAPSGQPPSPQSLQKVASPSRTIRSKRAAPPPPPAQPPAPPQNVRQLNDHCHSNNTEPPIRPSSEENEVKLEQAKLVRGDMAPKKPMRCDTRLSSSMKGTYVN